MTLKCDKCSAVTEDPWHTSIGSNRHVHLCDTCYAWSKGIIDLSGAGAASILARSIYDTAKSLGIVNDTQDSITGPQCLHLLDCIARLASVPTKVHVRVDGGPYGNCNEGKLAQIYSSQYLDNIRFEREDDNSLVVVLSVEYLKSALGLPQKNHTQGNNVKFTPDAHNKDSTVG